MARRFQHRRINGLLAEDTFLHVVPFVQGDQSGYLIENDSKDALPITELEKETDITNPLGIVVDHAEQTNTDIFIKIDHAPFDYGGTKKPENPLGADRTIELLIKDFGFARVSREDSVELLVFRPSDPAAVNPYRHIEGGDQLRKFIEDTEAAFIRLSDETGASGFHARQELDKWREAKRRTLKTLYDLNVVPKS